MASLPPTGVPKRCLVGYKAASPALLCSWCDKVAVDPVQGKCSHRFCDACMTYMSWDLKKEVCPACVSDGEITNHSLLVKENFVYDKVMKNEMADVDIICPHACGWEGKFKQYRSHMAEKHDTSRGGSPVSRSPKMTQFPASGVAALDLQVPIFPRDMLDKYLELRTMFDELKIAQATTDNLQDFTMDTRMSHVEAELKDLKKESQQQVPEDRLKELEVSIIALKEEGTEEIDKLREKNKQQSQDINQLETTIHKLTKERLQDAEKIEEIIDQQSRDWKVLETVIESLKTERAHDAEKIRKKNERQTNDLKELEVSITVLRTEIAEGIKKIKEKNEQQSRDITNLEAFIRTLKTEKAPPRVKRREVGETEAESETGKTEAEGKAQAEEEPPEGAKAEDEGKTEEGVRTEAEGKAEDEDKAEREDDIMKINDDLFEHQEQLQYLTKEMNNISHSLKLLEYNQDQITKSFDLITTALRNFEGTIQRLKVSLTAHKDDLQNVITDIKEEEAERDRAIRRAKLQLEHQISTSHKMRYVWKIDDVAIRRHCIKIGKLRSILSDPFTTGECGYTMCGKIWLGGRRSGKGTHLSLFFALMHGEYDSVLPWPFREAVTIRLIDPSGSGKDVVKRIPQDHVDLVETEKQVAFERPQNERNHSYGWFQFLPLSELDDFVANDAIFVVYECTFSL